MQQFTVLLEATYVRSMCLAVSCSGMLFFALQQCDWCDSECDDWTQVGINQVYRDWSCDCLLQNKWMEIKISEFVCCGCFLFMDENWNLGVCVLWAFSLHEWKLKSWSLCAMGISSSWMKIEILEFVCYGHFLFMNENWNLGVCVLWAFSLHEWKLKSWSLCAMGVFSSSPVHLFSWKQHFSVQWLCCTPLLCRARKTDQFPGI